MRILSEVLQKLPTTPDNGLTAEGVNQSRLTFGANVLTPLPREPLWKKFLEKFDEPIIKILLAAALLSMVVDLFNVSVPLAAGGLGGLVVLVIAAYVLKKGDWVPSLLFLAAFGLFFLGLSQGDVLIEGLAVMVAIILATGVAFASEYKSDREFEILNARKESLKAKVTRGGEFHTVPLEDVLVGDLVTLEMGDEIPADGRLIKATELMLDQSLMTGESNAVRKLVRPATEAADGPDQPGCLYRGTQVVDGSGQMIVTEVGDTTYLGQIARRLSADDEEEVPEGETAADSEQRRIRRKLTMAKDLTPLQVKLQDLAGLISNVGYIAAIAIFVAQLIRGIFFSTPQEIFIPHSWPDALFVFRQLLGYFVTMVIIIVVAVPEGLPMSVTVSLALAMRKMTRANSLVRQLVACETIGSATVICSDKTGTLTQNKMQVERISWDDQVFQRATPDWPKLDAHAPWPRGGKPLDWLALNAAANSTANLEHKEGKLITIGNSTEGALLHWLRDGGLEYAKLRSHFPPLYQLHFSSERKRMTTVIHHGPDLVALVKGAPEWVLDHCRHYQAGDGSTQPLTDEKKERIRGLLRESARLAMRTLAFAFAKLPPGTPSEEDILHERREDLENDLVFIGFVAIRDPLRDDVKAAIAECRQAGIEVKMITGDNVETARAIGYEIGLVNSPEEPIDTPGAAILTSNRFNELSDDQLKAELPRLRILARAKPLDKFRMVQLLQDLNEVVAVTGDGTNDAPALKKADVGLAMGIAGTEVSKEASKIVLLDDAFSTIVKAVHWGRSLYENIQRFIQFQLTINVSALVITFLGILIFNVKAPFTVLQLLWINVIMDTFASIALCSEPPRPGVMKLPPKRRDENILSRDMMITILSTSVFFVVVMLTLLVAMKNGFLRGNDETADGTFTLYQISVFFSVYVFFQVWNQINARALTPETSGLDGLFRNPTFLSIAAAVAVGQVLIVTFGYDAFKVQPLGVNTWALIILCTSSVLLFAEAMRRLRLPLRS